MSVLLERLIALVLLFLLLPLLVVVVLLVLIGSGWPLLHRDHRLSPGGQRQDVIKFRTLEEGRGDECGIAISGDPRITRPGRLLRKYRLDELPQLFQVLAGQLQLVGSRPLKPVHYESLEPAQRAQLARCRSGVLSAGGVSFIGDDEALGQLRQQKNMTLNEVEEVYISKILPLKVAADVDYQVMPGQLKVFRLLGEMIMTLSFARRHQQSMNHVMNCLEDS